MKRSVPIGLASTLTGVSVGTIRAWERRYGVPSPHRTANGRRSYNTKALNDLRLMRQLVASGLPASLAAKRIENGTSEARTFSNRPVNEATQASLEPILTAISNFNADRLSHELRCLALALPTHDFFDRVIVPLMWTLNERWEAFSPTDTVQEYITTQAIRKLMHELCSMVRPSVPRGHVLIAPFVNDMHILPLDALAYMLSAHGFRTLQLGPLTSPNALSEVVRKTKPDLIALSMSSHVSPNEASPLMNAYRDAAANIPWIIGGSAAQDLSTQIESAGAVHVPDGQALEVYLTNFVL